MHLKYTAKAVRSAVKRTSLAGLRYTSRAPWSRTPGAAEKFRRLERPAGLEVEREVFYGSIEVVREDT
jgi:hypothetical protein